ncbi:MAG: PHB depolymerase family esterase [Pseudomonadota bacterium]
MTISSTTLSKATRLLRSGRLVDATLALQKSFLKGVLGAVPRLVRPPRARRKPRTGAPLAVQGFEAATFTFQDQAWRYRLYEPPGRDQDALVPLVVMLHGCKQDAEDFARGTGMNDVAAREGFLVLYPEQRRKSNGMGCWNWFEPAHQSRESGEPAMLAALVRDVTERRGVDPRRVYVTGLSAGGAMAALLGELFPDVFAAVGVHSGLAPRAAHDVRSAFSRMRNGPEHTPDDAVPVPTIVFHGEGDDTVVMAHADAILESQLAAHGEVTLRSVATQEPGAADHPPRPAHRVRWLDPRGRARLESWTVASGPHAWSGGNGAGSYTDPHGPSASEAMARFFLAHERRE